MTYVWSYVYVWMCVCMCVYVCINSLCVFLSFSMKDGASLANFVLHYAYSRIVLIAPHNIHWLVCGTVKSLSTLHTPSYIKSPLLFIRGTYCHLLGLTVYPIINTWVRVWTHKRSYIIITDFSAPHKPIARHPYNKLLPSEGCLRGTAVN